MAGTQRSLSTAYEMMTVMRGGYYIYKGDDITNECEQRKSLDWLVMVQKWK